MIKRRLPISLFIMVVFWGLGMNKSSANEPNSLTCEEISQLSLVFNQGEQQLNQHHYQQAITYFDQGILQLGDDYVPPNVDDDTGMKLILADSVQQHNLLQAATLKRNVLSSRLTLVKQNAERCNDE